MNREDDSMGRSAGPAAGGCRRIAVVTETWPPGVNGVAMTTERMVEGLARASAEGLGWERLCGDFERALCEAMEVGDEGE